MKGDTGWHVWDCEACQTLYDVIWLDDISNEIAQYTGRALGFDPEIAIRRVRKIRILPPHLVLVNPKNLAEEIDVGTTCGVEA